MAGAFRDRHLAIPAWHRIGPRGGGKGRREPASAERHPEGKGEGKKKRSTHLAGTNSGLGLVKSFWGQPIEKKEKRSGGLARLGKGEEIFKGGLFDYPPVVVAGKKGGEGAVL